jgi:hypothetical protein
MTTFQGDIVDVQRVAKGHHQGVHLTVAMGSEPVTVHLGPDFYVDGQPLKLTKGDKVEVKGARTTVNGQAVVLALEVRRGDRVLALRDPGGLDEGVAMRLCSVQQCQGFVPGGGPGVAAAMGAAG